MPSRWSERRRKVGGVRSPTKFGVVDVSGMAQVVAAIRRRFKEGRNIFGYSDLCTGSTALMLAFFHSFVCVADHRFGRLIKWNYCG